MATPIATSANATGHCAIFQVHRNAAPKPTESATLSASVGPASTSPNDTRMKMARTIVRPTAVTRTRHHDRHSWTWYTWLRVLIADDMADEALQIVPTIPRVSRPPLLLFEISFSCSRIRLRKSVGANGASAPTI